MSNFYGMVNGAASTAASRRGHKDITVSAQSYDGSVITRLYYEDDVLMVRIQVSDGSCSCGETIFNGSFHEFCKRLTK